MKLLGIDALLAQLQTLRNAPYRHLSPTVRTLLDDALRVFELRGGDRLTLAIGNHPAYVSVLSGKVAISVEGEPVLHLEAGQTYLVATGRGSGMQLHTEAGTEFCVADSDTIDELMSLDVLAAGMNAADREALPALERARQADAFRRVPLECVEAALARMGRRSVKQDEEVVRQGDPGDAFYVIAQGRAAVWQTGLYDDAPQKVAELEPGDTFGEEALVTNGTRGATVRMLGAGELLVLDKADYQALISQQMIEEVDPPVAKTMLESGYRLLDVRYAEENEDSAIPGTMLIPLHELRGRTAELDKSARWIVYCRSGKRSAVATLLLRQRGLQAVSLRGGINGWPYETHSAY